MKLTKATLIFILGLNLIGCATAKPTADSMLMEADIYMQGERITALELKCVELEADAEKLKSALKTSLEVSQDMLKEQQSTRTFLESFYKAWEKGGK